MRIIGYEGARGDAPMTYGAAAVEKDDGRLWNAASGFGGVRTLADYAGTGALEVLPVAIEVDEFPKGACVFDLPTKRWEREPYRIGIAEDAYLITKTSHGDRTYLVFRSHKMLTQWMTGMHFRRGFSMQAEGPAADAEGKETENG